MEDVPQTVFSILQIGKRNQAYPMLTISKILSKNSILDTIFKIYRFKLLGDEVQRLHEDTEDNDGANPLRRWPTTKGRAYIYIYIYIYKFMLI